LPFQFLLAGNRPHTIVGGVDKEVEHWFAALAKVERFSRRPQHHFNGEEIESLWHITL
jgi:hypothetical protein